MNTTMASSTLHERSNVQLTPLNPQRGLSDETVDPLYCPPELRVCRYVMPLGLTQGESMPGGRRCRASSRGGELSEISSPVSTVALVFCRVSCPESHDLLHIRHVDVYRGYSHSSCCDVTSTRKQYVCPNPRHPALLFPRPSPVVARPPINGQEASSVFRRLLLGSHLPARAPALPRRRPELATPRHG